MDPERWRQIERLYDAALARPPEDRPAFLTRACGDPELRTQVESLLAMQPTEERFLEEPALEAAAFTTGVSTPALTGRRLGVYAVAERIGAGGMGEVYRARDTRLGRDVAIKILPPGFTADADRIARFEREARALAALNHPNIATIHGIEEADEVRALVMELVDGPTLADRIASGPIPTAEAIAIALAIADALDAAHEKGIVHRDLKPANVKVTPEGRVKVLDFGLAKVVAGQASPDAAESPTMTTAATRAGTIVGTAAYMSPEQAQGKGVDKRADIWAFACVLFEMLAGVRAFGGESITDVMVALMTSEPDWTRLPATTPAGVRELLGRCLQKDPRRRLRDIGDARFALEHARTAPTAETVHGVDGGRHRWREWLAWTASGVLAVVLFASWAAPRESADRVPSVQRLAVPLTVQPVLLPMGPVAAISPDGRRLAFVGAAGAVNQLYLHDVSSGETQAIPGTEQGWTPSFSPDGRSVLFRRERSLMRVSLEGGRPQTVADTSSQFFGADWTADDQIVFAPRYNDGLWRVSADGSAPERLTTPDSEAGELGHWWPDVLPGGRAVVYTVYRAPQSSATVSLYSFESGERKVLIEGATNGRYLASGHLAFVRERALQVVAFDLERLEVVGSPATVGDDSGYESESSTLLADVSDTGTLVYIAERDREVPSRLVAIGDDGSRAIVHGEFRRYSDPALSPDGRRLALAIDDGHRDVWVLDLARGAFTRVTFGPTEDFHPVWMPDGERLIYASEAPDWNMLRTRADGAGQPETMAATPLDEVPGSMLADGTLVFTRAHPETGFDLWVLPPGDGAEPRPFRQTPFSERTPAFSPDGRWIAYTSDESRRNEVYVEPFPGPGPRVQVSTDGGFGPVWSSDGHTLYYWSGDALRAASVVRQPALSIERSADVVTIARRHVSTFHADVDVLPDGRPIVLEPDPAAPPLQIHVVLNWFEEVRRRVP